MQKLNNVPFVCTKLFQKGKTIQGGQYLIGWGWGHYLRKTPDFGILPLPPKPVFVKNGHLTTYSLLSEGENAKYLQQQLSTSV